MCERERERERNRHQKIMEHETYDPTTRYSPSKPLSMISGSASFSLLELILDPSGGGPARPRIQDTILISMDLELRVMEHLGLQITQIGIASLDTRILTNIDTDDLQSLMDAIRVRLLSMYPKRASFKAWAPTSLWATPEEIAHDQVRDTLNEIFLHQGEENRDVVLIGHSIHSDRSLLKMLCDFDIKQVKSIVTILDTGRMICNAYDFGISTHSHFPLRMMLRSLGIRYEQLHDAGNDAMFTMKAFLLMFCNWKHQKGSHLWNVAQDLQLDAASEGAIERLLWDQRLDVLTAIARTSWPPRVSKKKVVAPRSVPSRPSRPSKGDIDHLSSVGGWNLTQLFS